MTAPCRRAERRALGSNREVLVPKHAGRWRQRDFSEVPEGKTLSLPSAPWRRDGQPGPTKDSSRGEPVTMSSFMMVLLTDMQLQAGTVVWEEDRSTCIRFSLCFRVPRATIAPATPGVVVNLADPVAPRDSLVGVGGAMLSRVQAKGSSVARAGKWRLQQQVTSSNSSLAAEAPASAPAPSMPAPSSPRPSASCSAAALPTSSDVDEPSPETEDAGNITPGSFDGAAVLPLTGAIPPAEGACQQQDLPPSFPPASNTPGADGGELAPTTTECPPPLLEEEAVPRPRAAVASPATETPRESSEQIPASPLLASIPCGSDGFKTIPQQITNLNLISPLPSGSYGAGGSSSPDALAAALTCAHGIGGRLGTPLGSPYPAPGENWVAGRSASASASASAIAAARMATRSGGGLKPSAPGSRFFPPFGSAVSVSSSAVLEMVRDAADDEEDVAAAPDATAPGGNGAAGRGTGWHGLTLYR